MKNAASAQDNAQLRVAQDARASKENAQRIAGILGIRKGNDLVRPGVLRKFQHVLSLCIQHPEESARPRLRAAFQWITHVPHRQASLALIELAWMIPEGSRLQRDVTELVEEWQSQIRNPWDHRQVRAAVKESQASPYPIVRHLAQLIRKFEPVDSVEIQILVGDVPGYADQRIALCERILTTRQFEYFGVVLDFIIEADRVHGHTSTESRSLPRLFEIMRSRQTASTLGREEMLLLFKYYVDNFEQNELRGMFMRVLTQHAERLAELLPPLVRERGEYLEPCARLLRQMVEFGYPQAVEAFGNIAVAVDGASLRLVHAQLLQAARSLAMQSHPSHQFHQVQGQIESLAAKLDEEGKRGDHQSLARALRALSWGAADIEDLVQRILENRATGEERKQLRACGRPAVDALVRHSDNAEIAVSKRLRTLSHLADFRNTSFDERVFAAVWNIYQTHDSVDLRCIALRTMAQLGTMAPGSAREVLWKDYETARVTPDDARLAQVIPEVWENLFREMLPTEL